MGTVVAIIGIVFCLSFFTNTLNAQNIYELRKFTDEDWIDMSWAILEFTSDSLHVKQAEVLLL